MINTNLSGDVMYLLEKFRAAVGPCGEGMPTVGARCGIPPSPLAGRSRQAGIVGFTCGETLHLPKYAEFLPYEREVLAELTSERPLERTGFIVYLPGSSMGWHTNSNRPGKRFYYTYNDKSNNVFHYAIEGQEYAMAEPAGWHLKEFSIPAAAGVTFPHAIEANSLRISIGFRELE